jgi:NADPH:quinone reductase-like Zn-dependent oxidoreductase
MQGLEEDCRLLVLIGSGSSCLLTILSLSYFSTLNMAPLSWGQVSGSSLGVTRPTAPEAQRALHCCAGTYGIKPQLPAIAGLEGVARVTKVGPSVKSLAVSDWVIPASTGKAFGEGECGPLFSGVFHVQEERKKADSLKYCCYEHDSRG